MVPLGGLSLPIFLPPSDFEKTNALGDEILLTFHPPPSLFPGQAKHQRSESAHSREVGRNYCRVWGVIPLIDKRSQIGKKLNLCRAMAILM